MLFFNYGDKPINTRLPSFTGPGILLEEPTPVTDFSLTYVAVKKFNQHYLCGFQLANFTNLSPGVYTIYGYTYKSGGTTPPNITDLSSYVGKKIQ